MKFTGGTALTLVALVVIVGNAQAPAITGAWESEVANVFWGFHLATTGPKLTGSVVQGTAEVLIERGIVSGNVVSFQVVTPEGDRTITFSGTVTGDAIAFTREVVVREGGNPGGAGLFGATGPRQFTARRLPPGQLPRRPRGSEFPSVLTIFDRGGPSGEHDSMEG